MVSTAVFGVKGLFIGVMCGCVFYGNASMFFCVAFMCPENLRYQACLPTCTAPSCPNQEFEFVPEQCTGLSEGCVCPEGTLLHRPYSALCIPPSKCGMLLLFLFSHIHIDCVGGLLLFNRDLMGKEDDIGQGLMRFHFYSLSIR